MMSDDKNCNETKVNRIKQLINLSLSCLMEKLLLYFFYVTQNAIILYMALSFNLFLTALVMFQPPTWTYYFTSGLLN
jgi:hypothetical protein